LSLIYQSHSKDIITDTFTAFDPFCLPVFGQYNYYTKVERSLCWKYYYYFFIIAAICNGDCVAEKVLHTRGSLSKYISAINCCLTVQTNSNKKHLKEIISSFESLKHPISQMCA